MRAYKTVNDAYIEPISFTVPRRAETFQADIFPPAVGTKPAATAQEWFDGKTAIPNKIDLESVYDGTAPKEITSDYKAPAAPAPVAEKPAPKEEPKREEPKPAPAVRSPPPTMNEQKGSISAMASRYQDKQEDEEEDDDASSFEEVSRPAQRQAAPAAKFTPPAQSQPASSYTPAAAKPASPAKTPTTPGFSAPAAASSPSSSAPSGGDPSFTELKQLIVGQTKQIGLLTAEVEALKRKVSSGSQDQSERIRQLELELEEARS